MYREMTENSEKSKIKSQIDENLKRIYDDVLKEAIPDRFQDLLQQLREKSAREERKQ